MPPPKTFGSDDTRLERRNRSVREVAVHLRQHLVVGFDVEKVEPTQFVRRINHAQREDVTQQRLKFIEPFDEGERLRTVVGIAGQLRLHRGRGIFRPDRTVVGEKRRHPFDALVTLVVGRHEDFQRDMERRLLVGAELAFETALFGFVASDGAHPPDEKPVGQFGRPDTIVAGFEVLFRSGGAVTVLFGIVARIAGWGDGCREDAFLKGRHRKKGLKG